MGRHHFLPPIMVYDFLLSIAPERTSLFSLSRSFALAVCAWNKGAQHTACNLHTLSQIWLTPSSPHTDARQQQETFVLWDNFIPSAARELLQSQRAALCKWSESLGRPTKETSLGSLLSVPLPPLAHAVGEI
jgi:hypothetical protein